MGAFGVVELEGASEGVEDGGRHTGERATFELGVVLDTDAGQCGDLAAAQSWHASAADVGHSGLTRCDLGATRGEELADLGSVVHTDDATTRLGAHGMPCQYTLDRDFPSGRGPGFLGDATARPARTEGPVESSVQRVRGGLSCVVL